MLETILIVALALCLLLVALPAALFGIALSRGWFTLPGPGPDEERARPPLPARKG